MLSSGKLNTYQCLDQELEKQVRAGNASCLETKKCTMCQWNDSHQDKISEVFKLIFKHPSYFAPECTLSMSSHSYSLRQNEREIALQCFQEQTFLWVGLVAYYALGKQAICSIPEERWKVNNEVSGSSIAIALLCDPGKHRLQMIIRHVAVQWTHRSQLTRSVPYMFFMHLGWILDLKEDVLLPHAHEGKREMATIQVAIRGPSM